MAKQKILYLPFWSFRKSTFSRDGNEVEDGAAAIKIKKWK